jgi:hypothetical protein
VEKAKGRYHGLYLGFVRDRSDPTRTGRARIHVPALTADDNSEENWLDWCLPMSGSQNLVVPPVDAPVFVMFEHGMITHGVYCWGWVMGDSADNSSGPTAALGNAVDPTWLQTDVTYATGGSQGPTIKHTLTADPAVANLPQYPYNKVWQSEGGMILEVDDSPSAQRARFYHPSGTTILIDSNGSVRLSSAGAIFQESAGDHVIALKPGATFKVIYNGGSGISVGADGVHVSGHQASILGRAVAPNGRTVT